MALRSSHRPIPRLAKPWSSQMVSVTVVPINWSVLNKGLPTDANSVRMGSILNNTNRYALTTWYTAKGYASSSQQAANYLDFGGVAETHIRPVASEAFGLAVSLKTGLYNPSVTGVDLHSAETKGAKTALWAAYAGLAGWLMWDDPYLSATDRQNIRQLVEYEANRLIGYQVPYYQNAAGNIVYPGDSKAEENAWNAMLLETAVNMMPNHPNVAAWTTNRKNY